MGLMVGRRDFTSALGSGCFEEKSLSENRFEVEFRADKLRLLAAEFRRTLRTFLIRFFPPDEADFSFVIISRDSKFSSVSLLSSSSSL